jgi:cell division transport system permease protein
VSTLLLTRRERLTQSWRKLSASGENALVPQTHLSGPMPWVIAIMVALTVIAAAAGLALRNTAKATEAELSGGATVQIVEAAPKARQDQAEKSLEHLRDFPGVTSVRLVPEEEIAALIEPWLGVESANGEDGGEDVPVPALIDVSMQGKVTADRIAALQASLRKVAPAARVDAQSTWLKPVFDAIESLQWLALALVALLALAMAAAVLLAARTALGTNRDTIEIVHLLGGTDHQIARVFQRSIGFDAAGGGTVGLALGMVVVLFLGRRFAGLGTGMVDGGALQWSDWLVLALIPIVGVVLATVTARITVMRTLREML